MPKGKPAIFDFSHYKDLESDYLLTDVWNPDGDDDCRKSLIDAISALREPERKILLTYAEAGTYVETARIFGVNPKTVKSYINKIKSKIIDAYECF